MDGVEDIRDALGWIPPDCPRVDAGLKSETARLAGRAVSGKATRRP